MAHLLVNGQPITDEAIRAEMEGLSRDPNLRAISGEAEKLARTRAAAEYSLIGRALVEQTAIADPRPIDADLIAKEVERQKALGPSEDAALWRGIEMELRINRTLAELASGAKQPTDEEVRAFYAAYGHNFRSPEMFHAAHIVKHVNEGQTEEQARAGIHAALAELERGDDFAAVAERWSDCKGYGGDLGVFPSGTMVQEFEEVLLGLKPGERSGVFVTPFGFHIAELRARQPAGTAGFEQVRADIERVMITMAEHRAFLAAVEQLRLRADIRRVADSPGTVGDRRR
jgi:peptidyl-prolyl cis-trans isomerase C